MRDRNYLLAALTILLLMIIGCSGSGSLPTTPQDAAVTADIPDENPRAILGMWQFICDPAAGTVEFAKIRESELHLNALKFLEPPPNLNLTIESPLKFNGNILDVDIGLRHPFLGQVQFTGFDVCGILITAGSLGGWSDTGLIVPGSGDTRLLNADGYTRWWNPTEFPPNEQTPIFGYKDGLLGTPDEIADFTATLNGYKYFSDYLQPNDPVFVQGVDTRGVFSAGKKNVRHYKIELGNGLIFNYAVDACWAFPTGNPPFHVPDDFPPKANRPEAWNISVREIENTLAFENSTGVGSGHLLLEIDVYDWFDAELNKVVVESLAGISPVVEAIPTGGGQGYSTYELDLPGTNLTNDGEINLLITVRSNEMDYQGLLPGENVSAFFFHTALVEGVIPQSLIWKFDDEQMLLDSVFEDRTPAIHQRTTYEIDIGLTRLEYIDDTNSRANWHMMTSDNNGESFTYAWFGNATHFGQTLKDLKVCQGPLGNSVFMYQSFLDWGQTMYQHASTARNPQFKFGPEQLQQNEGIYVPWTQHADEVIWAADDKVLCFGDRDGQIMYKKGSHAYSLFYNGGWFNWLDVPDTIIVPGPALISETRSICKDASGAIHLAYFGGLDYPWIKMITNSDGLGENWDVDVYIDEGFTDEYSTRIEPSLMIDHDGIFHATFIGELDPLYSILYSYSNDGADWIGYTPIYTNPNAVISEVTVDTFEFATNTIVVISFQMEGDIWMFASINGGATFSEPMLVSDGTGDAVEPDIRADAQGYVHIAWSQFKEELGKVDDYDIHYRRTHLEQD